VLKAGGVPPLSARIALTVNGNLRQEGTLDQMLWPPGPLLAKLSALFVLQPGDLIFTGTPAGVGPLRAGDRFEGRIDGLPPLLGVIV
jgi:fumarylpyruvate hydrolase